MAVWRDSAGLCEEKGWAVNPLQPQVSSIQRLNCYCRQQQWRPNDPPGVSLLHHLEVSKSLNGLLREFHALVSAKRDMLIESATP